MPLEDDISSFKVWAKKLAAPLDVLPIDDALKSVFKSPQSGVFFNMMKVVRPRQEVVAIRQNILLSKTEQMKEKPTVETPMKSSLPKELQRYLEIEALKKRKAAAQAKLIETKNEHEAIAAGIKAKNIKKMQLKHKLEEINTKADILEIKSRSLDECIKTEKLNSERIISQMPVRIKPSNAKESLAMNAIKESSEFLEEFYNTFPNCNAFRFSEMKNDIWMKLRKVFSNIPSYVLWCAILKLSEEQLQKIISLSKMDPIEDSTTSENHFTSFEIDVMKARAIFLKTINKCFIEKQETMKHSHAFLSAHETFTNDLKLKMNLYNTEYVHNFEEIIADYVIKYNTHSFNKAQLEFLKNEIEICKIKLAEGNRKIEDHHTLISSTQKIYSEIDSLINGITHGICQLGKIKEKIIYSKNTLQYLLKMQAVNHNNTNKTKFSNSIDSFEISDVLCSTKVDLENSFANATLRSGTGVFNNKSSQLAQHVKELAVFKDLPIGKLNLSNKCFFYLHPNPLITDEMESSALLQLIPGHLLTPNGSLQEIKVKLKWYESIRQYCAEDIEINVTLHEANKDLLNAKSVSQEAQITKLLDEIDFIGLETKEKLNKINKYYTFILDNPLRHFIPSTRLFNNRNYDDYESEFSMYRRMLVSSEKTQDFVQ